ncbi:MULTISPECIES: hypothetical protein [unclassified Nocardia]|uniref:hypothetical protein n=1 Tax=unclassified Nocardia TaxID=2637762 RepID=UPI001CE400B7|nr:MULTISPECIES: hypothetical protein [unclassified Nocardia]
MTIRDDRGEIDYGTAPLGPIAIGVAIVMLGGLLIALPRIPGWAHDCGATLIAMAVVLHLALAGGLLRWGIDEMLGGPID